MKPDTLPPLVPAGSAPRLATSGRLAAGKGNAPRRDQALTFIRGRPTGTTGDELAAGLSIAKTHALGLLLELRRGGWIMTAPGTTYHKQGVAGEPNTWVAVTPGSSDRRSEVPESSPSIDVPITRKPIELPPPPVQDLDDVPPPDGPEAENPSETPDEEDAPPEPPVRRAVFIPRPLPARAPIAPPKGQTPPHVLMVAAAVKHLGGASPVPILRRLQEYADGHQSPEGETWGKTAHQRRKDFNLAWIEEALVEAAARGLLRQGNNQRWMPAEDVLLAPPGEARAVPAEIAALVEAIDREITLKDLAAKLRLEPGQVRRRATKAKDLHLIREDSEDVFAPAMATPSAKIPELNELEVSVLSMLRSRGRVKAGTIAEVLGKNLQLVKDYLRGMKDKGLVDADVEGGLTFYTVAPLGFAALEQRERPTREQIIAGVGAPAPRGLRGAASG